MKFHANVLFLKDKKVIQPVKNLFRGKKAEIFLKVRLFGVGKKFVQSMCYFWIYMMHHSCFYDSVKTACCRKNSFSSYIRKCYQQIKLQDFLSFNISRNYLRYKVSFWNIIKFSWKLQFDYVMFFGFSQACPKCS